MVRARVGLGAFCIAALAGGVIGLRQFLPVVTDAPVSSIGPLVAVLSLVSYLVNPGGALVLGFAAGRATDFASEYGALAFVAIVTGFVGVVVGYGAFVVAFAPDVSGAAASVVLAAAQFALTSALTLGIAVVAGGAVATFRSSAFRSRPE